MKTPSLFNPIPHCFKKQVVENLKKTNWDQFWYHPSFYMGFNKVQN